ncbi:hypothetical protein BT63DRAFT_441234 [Microthyrium microscopicum]|uniref:Uncharacterized protein n=1 Tax=Microthyrium microscopicum TaxID=703497 RepID=A0A6A6U5S1_9PEZI|nr:hypothetical protein BT63DRAFT_441234 [Microthyrium microscopicum]
MFLSQSQTIRSSPCYFTHLELPTEIDPKNVSKRRKPFSSISSNAACHTVDMILPHELWEVVKSSITPESLQTEYHKVTMTLLEVISGDFFNYYIKTGNIFLLSEGRPHIDNRFSLKDGILRLELDKPTYERCGLTGRAIPSLGRKHIKSRYVIELNLRLAQMVRGKKGFDRIVWAFTRVLNEPVKWLFYDFHRGQKSRGEGTTCPIEHQNSVLCECILSIQNIPNAVVPIAKSSGAMKDQDYQEQLLEWLGLLSMDSPRVQTTDKVDKYICRYEVPCMSTQDAEDKAAPQQLVHVQVQGLMMSRSIISLFLQLRDSQKDYWFSLSAKSFEGNAYSILCTQGRETLVWELD